MSTTSLDEFTITCEDVTYKTSHGALKTGILQTNYTATLIYNLFGLGSFYSILWYRPPPCVVPPNKLLSIQKLSCLNERTTTNNLQKVINLYNLKSVRYKCLNDVNLKIVRARASCSAHPYLCCQPIDWPIYVASVMLV